MSDKKYSVDDILDEYSGSSADYDVSGITIDDIINSFANYGSEESDSFFDSTSEIGAVPKEDKNTKPHDRFAGKYDRLSSAVTAVKEREETAEPYVPAPKPDRSFSEKFESSDLYGDRKEKEKEKEKDFEKAGLSSIFKKKKEKPAELPRKPEAPIQTIAESKKRDDPFEKYSAIGEADKAIEEAQAAEASKTDAYTKAAEEDKAADSIDELLNEYAKSEEEEKKRARKAEGMQQTQHKGFTDFFTKLVPKPDLPEAGISGNTELIDGMLKAKKERISQTRHISPIERKTISDINLDLSGKILPDTDQLPDVEQQNELDKIQALKERRSKKIKDFVLVGDEEDVSEDDGMPDGEPVVIDDFENMSDAPSIAHDIAQLKGSMIIRLFVLVICFAASLYIAVANDTQSLPIMEFLSKRMQTNTFLFVNAILGLLAAFSSYTVISCGLSKLLSFKADCDSLCAVSMCCSLIETMIMFANGNLIRGSFVHIYVPVAIGSLMFNTLGKLFIVNRTQRSFRFISGSGDKYAINAVTDDETAQLFTRGALSDFPRLASMRKAELISDFLKTSYSSDSTDRFCRIFTPIVLGAAAVTGLVAGLAGRTEHGSSAVYIGISVFVGVVAICTGFSVMLVVNLPMLRASGKNADLGGVVIGYDCVEEFAETNSVLVDAEQLFPQGSVRLSAIKVFSDTRIDEAIVEAASLTTQAGSILKNMFYDIIAGKTELLNPVESYIFEDSMGLCGWINNKRVLLGNRELMTNHSIEGIPPEAKEKEYTENGRCAVYLSISGELSAMFLVEILPSMEVGHALRNLQRNGIYSMIRTVDSLVSINHLSELFEISPEYLKLIPFRVHEKFAEVTEYKLSQSSTIACSGRFAAFSSLILSCRRMKLTIGFGIGLQAVSMLLGILICLAMAVMGSFGDLSVSMEVMYNFLFTALLVVFQMLRRN